MATLVFIETDKGHPKKSSLEAISYAYAIDKEVTAIVFGLVSDFEEMGMAGAGKVLHIKDEKLSTPNIMAYASAISEAMTHEYSDLLVLASGSFGDAILARVAIKTDASVATHAVGLPDPINDYSVKTSIYSGKAFANTLLRGQKKIISINKNTIPIKEDGAMPEVIAFSPAISNADFLVTSIQVDKVEGNISLPEANIVVSGGRGLKGSENWGIIEELAQALGAATGCSKPVSDMGWRPHHEHVGQTGIKVSPSLYIAVGISGAIQHLAGINSSRYILVINKDADAPFFKVANYGVVGDAFEVLPKLTQAIKKIHA